MTGFVADSGSGAVDRKPSVSVRNGPLPPIPTSPDPVPNTGHHPSMGRRGGPGSMPVEQPTSVVGPRSGAVDRRESRREIRSESTPDTLQDSQRDPRRESWQDARQNSHQESRQTSQADSRRSSQTASILSSGVGCFIHANLPHEDVQKVFAPYLARNGSYLIRPSATAGKMTLCVT